MIKLVAFDWNGTLFADTYAVFESNNGAFKLLGLEPVSFRIFQKYFDVPVKKYYLAIGVSEHQLEKYSEEIAKTFHDDYEPRAARVRTRAGARQLLHWLSKGEINAVIFSNHITEEIHKQLVRLKIQNYISSVIANSSRQSSFKIRNKKDKLKNYLSVNGLSAQEVVIIGDTIEEVQIGKDLGVHTIALTHGNCSIKRLKESGPDHLISNLKEVISIINKLNK